MKTNTISEIIKKLDPIIDSLNAEIESMNNPFKLTNSKNLELITLELRKIKWSCWKDIKKQSTEVIK